MGLIAASWGLLGIVALFGFAIARLSLLGLDALQQPLQWYHWLTLVVWVIFMAYKEGYQGFQKAFSPRVAARVAWLYRNPSLLHTLLAPAFCMGYFHTTRKRQMISIGLTVMIVGLVLAVSQLEQPWRGIVDIGVVIGLIWGTLSLLLFTLQAFTQPNFAHSPELPQPRNGSEPA